MDFEKRIYVALVKTSKVEVINNYRKTSHDSVSPLRSEGLKEIVDESEKENRKVSLLSYY